jgi:hypothetical protein
MKAGLLLFFLSIATPVFASEIETVLMVSIDALHPAALRQKTSPSHPLPPLEPGVFLITELKSMLQITLAEAEK